MEKLLEVKNLKTYFYTDDGIVRAVDGVDFSLDYGKTLAIAGESGCGKSVTALSILRLVQQPGRITSGEIFYKGRDVLKISDKEMMGLRGKEISMVFQDPFTSLNPVFTIGDQIGEAIKIHSETKTSKEEILKKAIEMLSLVEMPSPGSTIRSYPHQLSGGMQQRAMIAMALSANPSLLIADEPTTALDLTIQAQILDLLERLKEKLGMSMIMITHNLGIIGEIADDVAVMYLGRIVEYSGKEDFFAKPFHPYTAGLMKAVPRVGEKGELYVIPGNLPSPIDPPPGCKFHPRCVKKMDICVKEEPSLKEISAGHFCRCWLY
jgi:oligopeptide/dipeptide ABC transporter ATP-binding protein